MAIKRKAPTSAARNLRQGLVLLPSPRRHPGLVLLPGARRHPGLVLLPGARRHLQNRKPEEGGSGIGFLGHQRPGLGYLPSALGAGGYIGCDRWVDTGPSPTSRKRPAEMFFNENPYSAFMSVPKANTLRVFCPDHLTLC